jgi:hypothetical protein
MRSVEAFVISCLKRIAIDGMLIQGAEACSRHLMSARCCCARSARAECFVGIDRDLSAPFQLPPKLLSSINLFTFIIIITMTCLA